MSDEELNKLLSGVTIAQGGVLSIGKLIFFGYVTADNYNDFFAKKMMSQQTI